jgi:hypothetical protein
MELIRFSEEIFEFNFRSEYEALYKMKFLGALCALVGNKYYPTKTLRTLRLIY